MQTGQNKIRIERLPDSIEKDSIRVEGVGNAVIVDVVYSPSAVKDDDALETDALEENKRLLYALKTQEQAWTEQLSILQRYSWTLNSATTPADALGGFLDAHLEARTKIDEKLADVRQKTEEAKKARVLLRKEAVEEGAQSRKCRARITVVVQALESGPAKLSLRYSTLHRLSTVAKASDVAYSGCRCRVATVIRYPGGGLAIFQARFLNISPVQGVHRSANG